MMKYTVVWTRMPVIMTKQRRRSRRLQTCQVHVSFLKTLLAIIAHFWGGRHLVY